jgi:hypothetical protein
VGHLKTFVKVEAGRERRVRKKEIRKMKEKEKNRHSGAFLLVVMTMYFYFSQLLGKPRPTSRVPRRVTHVLVTYPLGYVAPSHLPQPQLCSTFLQILYAPSPVGPPGAILDHDPRRKMS